MMLKLSPEEVALAMEIAIAIKGERPTEPVPVSLEKCAKQLAQFDIVPDAELLDHDPEGDAYAKGYAEGYKACVVNREAHHPDKWGGKRVDSSPTACKAVSLESEGASPSLPTNRQSDGSSRLIDQCKDFLKREYGIEDKPLGQSDDARIAESAPASEEKPVGMLKTIRLIIEDRKAGMIDDSDLGQIILREADNIDVLLSEIEVGK